MAKLTALGMTLTVDDSGGTPRDITNDVGSFSMNQGRAVIDVSGLDKSGFERLLGRSDMTLSLAGFYDPGTNLAHAVFKTVPTQAGTVTRTVALGFSTGTATAEMVASTYNLAVGNDGAFTYTADLQITTGTAVVWS